MLRWLMLGGLVTHSVIFLIIALLFVVSCVETTAPARVVENAATKEAPTEVMAQKPAPDDASKKVVATRGVSESATSVPTPAPTLMFIPVPTLTPAPTLTPTSVPTIVLAPTSMPALVPTLTPAPTPTPTPAPTLIPTSIPTIAEEAPMKVKDSKGNEISTQEEWRIRLFSTPSKSRH